MPDLIAGLEDADEDVRRECATALGRMGAAARPALPLLRKLAAEDEDTYVRRSALAAAAKIDRE